jgi:hypothetical protein
MSWFSFNFKFIVETALDHVGSALNSTFVNRTTSGLSGFWLSKTTANSVIKGIASPNPFCKALYFTSASLGTVSLASTCVCIISNRCALTGSIPVCSAVLAYGTEVGARGCSCLASTLDPTSGLLEKAIDKCIYCAN